MRLFCSHKSFYKLYRFACKVEQQSELAHYRNGILKKWETLKSKGLPDHEISELLEISRATYYRHKRRLKQKGLHALNRQSRRPKRVRQSQIPNKVRRRILAIRRANPSYGKLKITRILARDDKIILSASSVGRILSHYMETGQIVKYAATRKVRKKRQFKGHAQRWKRHLKPTQPGEMIQVDHMTVSKNQMTLKHFQAWDPTTKFLVAECYSTASSQAAARFLEKMQRDYPFHIRSIQVDGGSEFRQHFEDACQKNNIPLYVLPPRSPQLNGGVERSHRTLREDFYGQFCSADSIAAFRILLQKAIKKYNQYRPHQALKGLTPFEYNQQRLENTC